MPNFNDYLEMVMEAKTGKAKTKKIPASIIDAAKTKNLKNDKEYNDNLKGAKNGIYINSVPRKPKNGWKLLDTWLNSSGSNILFLWDLDDSEFKKLIEEKIKEKGDNKLIKIIVGQETSGPSRTFYIFKVTLKNYEIASNFEERPVLYFSNLNDCIEILKQIEDEEKLNEKHIPGYWFIWDHTDSRASRKLDAQGIVIKHA
jgi:hypothetical protein